MSVTKSKFSGSTDGRGIKIAATSTPGTTIHTAVAGTTVGTYDEIWLWLTNTSAVDVVCTIEFGGTTAPDDTIVYTVTAKDGLKCVLPGLALQNGSIVKVFAASANVITAHGFVNKIV